VELPVLDEEEIHGVTHPLRHQLQVKAGLQPACRARGNKKLSTYVQRMR
jgi:hypothetical protein